MAGPRFIMPEMNGIWQKAIRLGGMALILAGGLSACGPRPPAVPIFMFHRVAAETGTDMWTITPGELDRILGELKRGGYQSVFPDEIRWRGIRRGAPVARPVILTFDDGDLSLLTDAEPILRRHGFKALIYISTAEIADAPDRRIRKDGRAYLTWPEIRDLRRRGVFEFGAHGHRHLRADQVADPAAELRACLESFQKNGGFRPTAYSYPFGVYTKDWVAALKRAGFTTAVTCTERPARIAWGAKPYKLPRIWVRGVGPPLDVRRWLEMPAP